MNALDISAYLVELASENPENDLTNLKLQKMLYFAQGKYLAQTGDELFGDRIEAWKYGPVVPDVYHAFKTCGQFPITVFDIDYDYVKPQDTPAEFINSVWQSIGLKYSGYYLVQKTHEAGTPWSSCYSEDRKGVEIPKESLKEYFTTNEL